MIAQRNHKFFSKMLFSAVLFLSVYLRQTMSFDVEAISKPMILGEGAHWDVENQYLYFVDDFGSSIHRYRPSDNRVTSCKISESPGVSIIVPIKDTKNKFAVTIGRSLCIVTWDGESEVPEKIETLTSVEDGLKTQFNDGKVDPTGRLWVGTMSEIAPDGSWTPHLGSLYSFHKNGTSIKHLEKISVSNGLIWNKDQNKMFYIDSPTKRVDVLDFDPALGTINHVLSMTGLDTTNPNVMFSGVVSVMTMLISGNRKMFFDVGQHITSPSQQVGPDGMTIDENDNLWFAVYGQGVILNVNGVTGDLIQKIELPIMFPTSVAFGGQNLDELYVTTASLEVKKEDKEKYPKSGCTLKITGLGVKGRRSLPADF